jgi:inositol oxygenase
MYLVAKKFSTIPEEGLAMIRFHSFYPWHRENAYSQFMKAGDDKLLKAVREFNPYDLYTKADEPVDVDTVKGYYQGLIRKYFADVVEW